MCHVAGSFGQAGKYGFSTAAPSASSTARDAGLFRLCRISAAFGTGPGIPKHQQENIFNPFFTTKPTGTGLGLSISHQIIKRQGGTFTLESMPDSGTTFIIELPAASPRQKKSQPAPVESCGMEN